MIRCEMHVVNTTHFHHITHAVAEIRYIYGLFYMIFLSFNGRILLWVDIIHISRINEKFPFYPYSLNGKNKCFFEDIQTKMFFNWEKTENIQIFFLKLMFWFLSKLYCLVVKKTDNSYSNASTEVRILM